MKMEIPSRCPLGTNPQISVIWEEGVSQKMQTSVEERNTVRQDTDCAFLCLFNVLANWGTFVFRIVVTQNGVQVTVRLIM